MLGTMPISGDSKPNVMATAAFFGGIVLTVAGGMMWNIADSAIGFGIFITGTGLLVGGALALIPNDKKTVEKVIADYNYNGSSVHVASTITIDVAPQPTQEPAPQPASNALRTSATQAIAIQPSNAALLRRSNEQNASYQTFNV